MPYHGVYIIYLYSGCEFVLVRKRKKVICVYVTKKRIRTAHKQRVNGMLPTLINVVGNRNRLRGISRRDILFSGRN